MVRLFGRKKDDFPEIGTGLSGMGVPGPASDPMGSPGVGGDQGFPSFPPAAAPQPSMGSISNEHIETISKNIELLSSKLDALKASIDSMTQRLVNMENQMRQQTPAAQPQQPQQNAFQQQYGAQQQPQQQSQQSQEDQGWHY